MAVVDWLLAADPALRWQVLRDLTDASPAEVAAERARVAVEGWGARLLATRDADGQWAGGACFPAGFLGDFSSGQPWTSTLPALTLLRELGVDPAAPVVREAVRLVADNCRWEHAVPAAVRELFGHEPVDDAGDVHSEIRADGPVRPNTARCGRPSTPRSVCWRGCSRTIRARSPLPPANVARSTCCGGTCSGG